MPKTKVLIVEDDRSLVEVLTYNLKAAGYETIVATDGQDGLLKAQTRLPEIVVLDLMLPVVSGLDVCRRLRAEGIETVRGVGYRFREHEPEAEYV
jgi:two-component system phosphate regulon response regulator PhoB